MIPKSIRNIVYFVFVITFLILAPLIVLFTAGYRFEAFTFQFVETGVLSLSSIPRRVNVRLNGKTRGSTPTVLHHLLPGTYDVSLTKEGYLPWAKTLTVRENETTFAHNRLLFLDDLPSLVLQKPWKEHVISPSGEETFFLRQEDAWNEIWKYDQKTVSETLLARLSLVKDASPHIFLSAKGSYVLIEQQKENASPNWMIVQGNGGSPQAILKDTEVILAANWDPIVDNRLYLKTATGMTEMNITLGIQTVLLPFETLCILRQEENLIYLQTQEENVALLVRPVGSEKERVIAYLPTGTYTFKTAPAGTVLLQKKETEEIFLVDMGGGDQPILLSAIGKQIAWNPQLPQELLYATDFEIHLYDKLTHQDRILTRLSHPVGPISWYPKGSVILYEDQGTIMGMEEIPGENPYNIDLAHFDTVNDFRVNEDGRTLTISGEKEGVPGLYERQLQR